MTLFLLQVYEGMAYKMTLSFPSDYPCSAPTVKFETPCYHPNVDQHGNICLDILKEDAWSAAYDVASVLRSIQSLLSGTYTLKMPSLNGPTAITIFKLFLLCLTFVIKQLQIQTSIAR